MLLICVEMYEYVILFIKIWFSLRFGNVKYPKIFNIKYLFLLAYMYSKVYRVINVNFYMSVIMLSGLVPRLRTSALPTGATDTMTTNDIIVVYCIMLC